MTQGVGSHHHLRGWVAAAAIIIVPAALTAQDSTCTFDACALTVRTELLGTGIYEGPDQRHIATLGLFPGVLDAFRDAPDSSIYYYNRFQHHYTVGSALAVTALIGAAAGSILALTVEDGQLPILVGTAIFSGGFSFVGSHHFSVGRRRLERSVMWHNRGLLGAERRIDNVRH